jgi:hypothetical protein
VSSFFESRADAQNHSPFYKYPAFTGLLYGVTLAKKDSYRGKRPAFTVEVSSFLEVQADAQNHSPFL